MTDTTDTTTRAGYDFTGTDAATVTDLYRAATPSEKARMRADITDAITDAVVAGDVAAAQHAVAMRDAMTAAPKSTTSVDYAVAIANHAATLYAAYAAVVSGAYVLPDGVTVDHDAVNFDAGTPDSKVVTRLVSIAGRKSGRGNVADFIASVVTDVPATIAAMRAAWVASEDYPTAPPSSGAIGACLLRDDDDRFAATVVGGKAGAVATA